MKQFINIADLKNKETNKTFREENEEKTHKIPLGTLVEVVCDDSYSDRNINGLRLFVVDHTRDCDGTPLYGLSYHSNWKPDLYGNTNKQLVFPYKSGFQLL